MKLNELLNKDLLFELYKSQHKPNIKNIINIKYSPQIITGKLDETKGHNAMVYVSNKKYADTLEEAQECLELALLHLKNNNVRIIKTRILEVIEDERKEM